jgi:signal transduction histidine kinase
VKASDAPRAALEQTRSGDDILRNIRAASSGERRGGCFEPTAEQLLDARLSRNRSAGGRVIGKVSPDLATAIQLAAETKTRTTRGEGVVTTGARRFPIGVTTTYTEHDPEGGRRTATAIFQDLSDQKRMDALRLRAERLEGIAELSASLAHEIKNPLASIRSAVEQIGRCRRHPRIRNALSAPGHEGVGSPVAAPLRVLSTSRACASPEQADRPRRTSRAARRRRL